MTDLLRGVHKDARHLAQVLIDAGWQGRRASNGTVTLTPPDKDERPIRLPVNSKSVPRALVKAADRVAAHAASGVGPQAPGAVAVATLPPPSVIADVGMAAQIDDVVARGTERHAAEREVVRQGPWMARKNPGKRGGTVYPSPAVIERHWSDGTIDYVCSAEGCDYSSTNPRGVAAHHGFHNRGQEWTPPTQTVIDPTYTEPMTHRYTPTSRLVALVAEQIRLALAAGMSPEEIATALLEWQHERPDRATITDDQEPMFYVRLPQRGEGSLAVREALQRAVAEGVFDPWLLKDGERAATLLPALRALAEVWEPGGAPALSVWIGQPVVEAGDGLPTGARPAWVGGGSGMCGWMWEPSAGVGADEPRDGSRGQAGPQVFDGPIRLPADVSVMPPFDGLLAHAVAPRVPLSDVEIVERIRLLVEAPTVKALAEAEVEIATLRERAAAAEGALTRAREERSALADLLRGDL